MELGKYLKIRNDGDKMWLYWHGEPYDSYWDMEDLERDVKWLMWRDNHDLWYRTKY